jgi:hypothetical protein
MMQSANAGSGSALLRLTFSVTAELARLPFLNSSRGHAASTPPRQWLRVSGWPSRPAASRQRAADRERADVAIEESFCPPRFPPSLNHQDQELV